MAVYLLLDHRLYHESNSELWITLKLADGETSAWFQKFVECYERLPNAMQMILLLNCYDEIPVSEIAEMLECEKKIVEKVLRNAILSVSEACGRVMTSEEIRRCMSQMIESYQMPEKLIENVRNAIRDFGDL